MNIDYQKARDLMVENQLRPNKIKDSILLNIFKKMPKEAFIPDNLEFLTYSDMDIPLSQNRGYLKNLHIAQLLKHAEIEIHHNILHVGALTGYVTFLLSNLCSKVFAIENENKHLSILEKNLSQNKIKNINIIDCSFEDGNLSNAPFDRIIIDCPVHNINKNFIRQLSDNLGQLIMIKKKKDHLGKAIKITKNDNKFSEEYLFDVFSKYELYKEKKGFVF